MPLVCNDDSRDKKIGITLFYNFRLYLSGSILPKISSCCRYLLVDLVRGICLIITLSDLTLISPQIQRSTLAFVVNDIYSLKSVESPQVLSLELGVRC